MSHSRHDGSQPFALESFLVRITAGSADAYLANLTELMHLKLEMKQQELQHLQGEVKELQGQLKLSKQESANLEKQLQLARQFQEETKESRSKQVESVQGLLGYSKSKSLQDAEKKFAGWLKIGDQGQLLPADATQWAAIVDESNKLMWAVNPGGTAGFPLPVMQLSWDRANEWVKEVNQKGWCGFRDWRLPTVEELRSFVLTQKKYDANFRRVIFPDMPVDNYYWVWSSTISDRNNNSVWFVGLIAGNEGTYSRFGRNHIRLVRALPETSLVNSALCW